MAGVGVMVGWGLRGRPVGGVWPGQEWPSRLCAQLPCLSADVDECAAGHSGCEHHCSNLAGSFRCFCEAGYRLDEDRRGCTREPPLGPTTF